MIYLSFENYDTYLIILLFFFVFIKLMRPHGNICSLQVWSWRHAGIDAWLSSFQISGLIRQVEALKSFYW